MNSGSENHCLTESIKSFVQKKRSLENQYSLSIERTRAGYSSLKKKSTLLIITYYFTKYPIKKFLNGKISVFFLNLQIESNFSIYMV